jgi:hypothetical protein
LLEFIAEIKSGEISGKSTEKSDKLIMIEKIDTLKVKLLYHVPPE